MRRDPRSLARRDGYRFRPRWGRRILIVAVLIGVGAYFLRGPARRWLDDGSHCGWTVQGDVVLDRDVVDCDRHGVRLAPFANLDCAGHEIRGRDGGASGYGVRLDGVEQATVRNCRISGFSRGVRVRGGRQNGVIANEVSGNGYGIEVAGKTDGGRSEGHRISRNRVLASARDGIHIGAGTAHTVIEENTILDSGEEGLVIESCRKCEVIGNTIEGSASAAIDLKDSISGRFLHNSVRGSLVKIRAGSERNLFQDNELVDSGYLFASTKSEGAKPRVPSQNRVVGGSVRDSKVCFRFRGARDNAVVDVVVSGCQLRQDDPVGTLGAAGNELSGVDVVPETSPRGGGDPRQAWVLAGSTLSCSRRPYVANTLGRKEPMPDSYFANYPGLRFERRDHGILWVTIDRPEALNATDARLHLGLSRVWDDIDDDDDTNVVVITGSGDAFSAGGDLEWIESFRGDYGQLRQVMREAGDVVYRMLRCRKVIISAIKRRRRRRRAGGRVDGGHQPDGERGAVHRWAPPARSCRWRSRGRLLAAPLRARQGEVLSAHVRLRGRGDGRPHRARQQSRAESRASR